MTELLPLALQYGMSTQEFWYEDKYLFYAYQKAYYARSYQQSWLNGVYVNLALRDFGNLFLNFKGKDNKELHYPEKPLNQYEYKAEPMTEQEIEDRSQELMNAQSNWLKNRYKK